MSVEAVKRIVVTMGLCACVGLGVPANAQRSGDQGRQHDQNDGTQKKEKEKDDGKGRGRQAPGKQDQRRADQERQELIRQHQQRLPQYREVLEFTLGAEGSVAAGPVGRTATAQTDAQLHADILSWSRSQGLFAGLALEGATLRQDLDDNATLHGKKLENRDIVTSGVRPPKAVTKLLALLNRYSASEH